MSDEIYTPHSLALLNTVDRVACLVIDGQEVTPAIRERLECSREVLERILDGRIANGTDHLKLWGEVSRVGWEKTYGKKVA